MDLSKLPIKKFAVVWMGLVKKIKEDPIKNFIEAPGFMDFKPSPAQKVALKIIFGQELDYIIKQKIWKETIDSEGRFDLVEEELYETELYERMTGKPYLYQGEPTEETIINMIDLIIGRRGGKCLAEGTLVKTPTGSRAIETLKEKDLVYGYNKDGTVTLTPILQVHDQGIKEVFDLVNGEEIIATCTAEHRWLAHNTKTGERKVRHLNDFDTLDAISKERVPICGGNRHIETAYSAGIFLGVSCFLDHEQTCDLEEVRSWNRESQLQFVAGLIDSEGNVCFDKKENRVCLEISLQAKDVITTLKYLYLDLFGVNINITEDDRPKYRNGKIYRLRSNTNDCLRIIKELDPFLVTPEKKYKKEYEEIKPHNSNDLFVGVRKTNRRKVQTYDLSLGNDSHLYLLANDTVTHNTTLSAMLAIYCAITTNWKPFLRKTPTAHVLLLSHSRDFSDEVLDLIRELIEESPVLTRLINKQKKNTTSTMNLVMPFIVDKRIQKSRVTIKVGAASKKTTRGTAACAVLCDEIAYWNLDENLKETDAEILKAVRPNMKQFGRKAMMIKLSSPGIKQGVLYGENQKWIADELPSNYVVFKNPSWVWNTILPKQEFIDEWTLDQDGFDTEYRSNFVDSLSNFILPEFIELAVQNGIRFNPPEPKEKGSRITYKAAIDAAFKKDRFTFSVVGHTGNRIKQFISKGWEGTRTEPIKANVVALYIRQICKEYDIPMVAADQFSFQPLKEIFEQYGIILEEYTFNPTFKKKIYFNLKRLIHSQQLDLLDNPIQTKEIKELIVEQAASGNIKISHPTGGTDDFADSTAIACHLVTEEMGGSLKADFKIAERSYGIKTDINGTALSAPSPEMLSEQFGQSIMDNSDDFIKHPETGKLVRKDELEDEPDDGMGALF